MTTHTTDLQAVLERLEKLEKQNRWLRRVGAMFLILAASVLLMGQAAPKRTVEANEFILKDANGKKRARLFTTAHGPQLFFMDTNRKPRVGLFQFAGASGVSLNDANLKTRAEFSLPPDGPSLRLHDANTHGQVNMQLTKEGPSLSLRDHEGFQANIGSASLAGC